MWRHCSDDDNTMQNNGMQVFHKKLLKMQFMTSLYTLQTESCHFLLHTLLSQDRDKAALLPPIVPHLARLAVPRQRAEGGGGVAGPAPALAPAQLPPEAVLPGDGVHGHAVARGTSSVLSALSSGGLGFWKQRSFDFNESKNQLPLFQFKMNYTEENFQC